MAKRLKGKVALITGASLNLFLIASALACPEPSWSDPPDDQPSPVHWRHLSSKNGDLPVPGPSTQQTGAIVADFDHDGVTDFVLSFRQRPPALVWYRRTKTGWDRLVIESGYLTIEAGGAVHDIDGDGDLDLVFGADYQGNQLWWWENPAPRFDPGKSWRRHAIKASGGTQHHDQVFGDFLGKGRPQLVFWNQGDKQLILTEIPQDPRRAGRWLLQPFAAAEASAKGPPYMEGLAASDIDGDGRLDILAGNGWFKHGGEGRFSFIPIAESGGRIAAGNFKPGRLPQVVIAPGDGVGPLMIFECKGDPIDPDAWKGRKLLERPMVHGHSLEVGDIDGDGHLDIFAAEMAKWQERKAEPDHPDATAWLLFGDGQGQFRTTVLSRGIDFHEARVADLDGDGDLDILDKPYNWEAPRVDVWINEGKSGR
jgi:hypothetical protein